MQGADSAFMQIQHQVVPGQMNMQDSMSQPATSMGPMAGPSPAPFMPQPQALALADQFAQPQPRLGAAAAGGAQIDDDQKLSTSYRVFGLHVQAWLAGNDTEEDAGIGDGSCGSQRMDHIPNESVGRMSDRLSALYFERSDAINPNQRPQLQDQRTTPRNHRQ